MRAAPNAPLLNRCLNWCRSELNERCAFHGRWKHSDLRSAVKLVLGSVISYACLPVRHRCCGLFIGHHARRSQHLGVLGVDDFAFRRGRVYGTILVDLEQHHPVDLLPDRSAATFARWLREYPGIEVLARDRSTEYTRGANEGAPTARQVADRWHLLLNLREALERMLYQKRAQLQQLPVRETECAHPAPPAKPQRIRPRSRSEQIRHDASRSARAERHARVRHLVDAGLSERAIARRLQMSRTTVRVFAAAATLPERAIRRPRASMLDPFIPYLLQRWHAGCRNGSQLWRELRAQGYDGALRHVLRWLQHLRTEPAPTAKPTTSRRGRHAHAALHEGAVPAPRQLAWLLLRAPTHLQADERALLARLQQDTQLDAAYRLAQQFQQLVRARQASALVPWIDACAQSGIADLQTFAAGIQRDEAAIRNALLEPWSTGPVEGHINRLKMVKRQMYGRAGFDLLRQRVLHSA